MGNNKFNVINFHLTERCNYSCTYCFAKFNNDEELDLSGWMAAVDLVANYYKRNNIVDGRINLAGGEPLVLKYFDELIDYIYLKGIKVSIITNGSFLTIERINCWVNKVDTLGVSIDSLNSETNFIIGRNQGKSILDIDLLVEVLQYAKEKGIKLKVNTVVSKLNVNEDILPLYERVEFDRVKLLQVRIQDNCNEVAKTHEITNKEFEEYSKRIMSKNSDIIIEPESEIESSYIIIDPQGYLIANKGNDHQKDGSIFNETLEDLITKAEINYNSFNKRYTTSL